MVAQAAASCFFYDSRWGQAEAEQRRTAKRSTPAALSPAKRERGLALDGRHRVGGLGAVLAVDRHGLAVALHERLLHHRGGVVVLVTAAGLHLAGGG